MLIFPLSMFLNMYMDVLITLIYKHSFFLSLFLFSFFFLVETSFDSPTFFANVITAERNYGLSPSTSLAPDQSKENSNTTTPLDISSNSCSNIPCMPPHHLPVKSLGSAATVSQSSIFMFLLSFLGFLLIKISTTGA